MTLSEKTAVIKVGLFCRQCGFKIESFQKEGLAFSIPHDPDFSEIMIYGIAAGDFIAFSIESKVPHQDGSSISTGLALRQFKRNAHLFHCFWSINRQDDHKFQVMSYVPFSQLDLEAFKDMVAEMVSECVLFNTGVAHAAHQFLNSSVPV